MRAKAVLLAVAMLAPGAGSVQAFDWSGFYAGVQGGVFSGAAVVSDGGSDFGSVGISGPFAGGFAGFNVQHNSIVFGVEADLNFAAASGEGYINNTLTTVGGEIDMFGSVRKRVGITSDNWLFFGTAGIAFARGSYWSQYCPDGCADAENVDASLPGVVIGAGAEYAMSDNLTIRADVRYYNFGAQQIPFPILTSGVADIDLDAVTASVGISWHF